MKIYFAGPLFCQAELLFNASLTQRLENIGYSVYLPQRDNEPFKRVGRVVGCERAIFDWDVKNILDADILLFILDGRVPDEGACVELGIAYMHQRFQKPDFKIIGLMTDSRYAFDGVPLNPMLSGVLNNIFKTEKELLADMGSLIVHNGNQTDRANHLQV